MDLERVIDRQVPEQSPADPESVPNELDDK
jgi:hypothetical protein